jgi:hypothetical protein
MRRRKLLMNDVCLPDQMVNILSLTDLLCASLRSHCVPFQIRASFLLLIMKNNNNSSFDKRLMFAKACMKHRMTHGSSSDGG